MSPDPDQLLVRVPRLIAVLGLIGAGVAGYFGGLPHATAFLIGAAAAYFNFRLIERFVSRLLGTLAASPAKPPRAAGLRLFIQLVLFFAGAFAILRVSGFSIAVALYGFLVCPAAVIIEAVHWLVFTYGHS